MEIYSFAFVLLVTVGLVLYYTVLRRCQWLCLLAISLVFFAASGWQGIFFLFFTALTVWGAGSGLPALTPTAPHAQSARHHKGRKESCQGQDTAPQKRCCCACAGHKFLSAGLF